MKKRTTILAIVVLAVGVLAAAPLVIAGQHGSGPGAMGMHGGPGGGPGMHGGPGGGIGILGHLQHAKTELGLTDQQVEQIRAIFTELHETNGTNRDQMRDGLHEAAAILLANPSDLAGAQAVLDRQAAAERVMKTNMLNATAKAFAVLTAEQRAKLSTMIEEHSQGRGRGR
jgi:Spy/CpxP family protein refolding chaperone